MGLHVRNQSFTEPPISFDTAKWFCITAASNRQNRVAMELYGLGYRTFMPTVRRWVSHARVKRAVDKPLLGRYVFVEVDYPRQAFETVRSVNGVDTLIATMGIPTVFPSHWIEGLMLRQLKGEWDEVAQGKAPVGARIRIVEGEFENELATLTSRKGGTVSLKLLGTNTYVKLHECSVRAA